MKQIDELLNKVPTTTKAPQPPQAITEYRQVTFAEASKPPQETQPTQRETNERPTLRVVTPHPSITNATGNKPILQKIPPPNAKENFLEIIKLQQLIRNTTNSRARIPQHHQMILHRQDHLERAQLIYDQESGEYLNYCQLLQDHKHKAIWSKSSANVSGCLPQEVG